MRMGRRTRSGRSRGSALVLVTVLLAALAIIGVAAVSLGSRARINASAKGRRDRMAACANAARLMIWAELSRFGRANLAPPTGTNTASLDESRMTLPDGTMLSLAAHYASDPALQQNVSVLAISTPMAGTTANPGILTNTLTDGGSLASAQTFPFVVRCRDADGREIEVELSVSLIL